MRTKIYVNNPRRLVSLRQTTINAIKEIEPAPKTMEKKVKNIIKRAKDNVVQPKI